ncbi:MAG TPA: protein-export chaperone SecB [Gammaproteobacteria bacterium]|nr:protein-export chaperone SecB [Gammaproteobacteria bacterium]
MADNDTTIPASQAGEKQVMLSRIYVKDCSFESPRAPEVFTTQMDPEVKVSMRTNSKQLDANSLEVVLSITIEAQSDKKPLFLVEVHQAGVFAVVGFNEAERGAIIGSYCPSILFPYAREAVSDLVIRGGMPVLLLQPVNFDAVYAQSLAQGAGPGATA